MGRFTYITRVVSAIILLLLMISVAAFAQTTSADKNAAVPDNKTVILPVMPYHGEMLPTMTLKEVPLVTARVFKSEKDKQAYLKLKRDVRKAYPFAILASVKLKEYDAILANTPEKDRDKYLKEAEKNLKTQFESDLKKLTMKQGKILIRLINRETGITTYKVIKDYRGGFSAFMWQSFGLLWGNNLKWKYDPTKGEDKLIEEIIQEIQDKEV